MKSVVFVSYSLGIGGVEKAFLGVVNNFIRSGWEVHVALIKPEGEFIEYLPAGVFIHSISRFEHIKPLIHTPMRQTIIESLKKRDFCKSFLVGVCLIDSKLSGGARMLYNYAFRNVPKLSNRTFDLAVAFAGPDAFIDTYVDKCIDAKEKWGWIHFDITKFGTDSSIISQVYKKYSQINVVSEQAKRLFDKAYPSLSNKTKYIPNIVDAETIIKMSTERLNIPDSVGKYIILTVGRVSKEKGQFKALQALEVLLKHGFDNLEWWFVGDGTDMERCKQYAQEARLTRYVHFIGAKANPYPYMKRCDLYVQPSEHEGFCITLAEAKLFGMPIIATDFTGAHEQLDDYSRPHMIVSGSVNEIVDAMRRFIL